MPTAVGQAGALIDGALQRQFIPIALKALLLRAQIHVMLGDEKSSRDDYVAALGLGQPQGFISTFVEEGTAVAAARARRLGLL